MSDRRRRRRAILIAASLAAVLMAALLVAAPPGEAIVLGRPGDAPFLTGFGPRAAHRGLPGRWTGGLGRIDLPPSPMPADVTLQLQAAEDRAPEAVEIFVDGARAAQPTLAAGRQTIALRIPACDAPLGGCRGRRIAIRSTAWRDPTSGETRGVFVARVTVARGGFGAPASTWLAALALAAGVVAVAFTAARTSAVAVGAVAWGFAALWIFRGALAPAWPWLALAFWFAAAVRRFSKPSGDGGDLSGDLSGGVSGGASGGASGGFSGGDSGGVLGGSPRQR